MKKYALIGRNIQDSLSPVIHGAYGCQYDLLDVEEDKLEWALSQPYDGFNVTSPYKEKICEFLKVKPVHGVVNTIKNGVGYNTDVRGFNAAINIADVHLLNKRIGFIGNGAMTKILRIVVDKYRIIPHYGNIQDFTNLDGLINCTPRQNFDLEGLPKDAWVMDLGYKDDTFIKTARARGNFAFNGMGMLIAQAEESQRIWNS